MPRPSKNYKEYLYERLRHPAEAAEYINGALDEEDFAGLLLALRDVAEARGVGKIASAAGLNRENVYRILSGQGNPRLSSLMALLRALGVQLRVEPQEGELEELPENFVIVTPELQVKTESGPKLPQLASGSTRGYGCEYGSEDKPIAA